MDICIGRLMNLTNSLLFIVIIILVEQFYSTQLDSLRPVIIGCFILYGCYWLVVKFPVLWKKRRIERLQEQKDEAEFREWQRKHNLIRTKYDPEHKWNEVTSVPQEYLDEIRSLNIEHQKMLQRRNGFTANDIED